jgi:hypothetical protein
MTELSTAPAAATMPLVVPVAAEPTNQVLITEQQVLFSTAAAAPLAPLRPHRIARWLHAFFDAPQRPKPPARLDFLERSLMSREMGRL